jgi:TPR repeat protein
MMAVGDVSAARLLYERAAQAGSGEAAADAGKTYDPSVLFLIGAVGIQPDRSAAARWYRRAIALGDQNAGIWLAGLGTPVP